MAMIGGTYVPDQILSRLGFYPQFGSLSPVQGTPPERQQVQSATTATGADPRGFIPGYYDPNRGDVSSLWATQEQNPSALGGWWSYSDIANRQGTQVPEQVAVGAEQPSTDNWTLLPEPYNQPGWIQRNGNIINTRSLQFLHGLPLDMPYQSEPGGGFGGPASGGSINRRVAGYPAAIGGAPYQLRVGWPGALSWPGGQMVQG